MATSRQYELVYIVSPEATDQEVTDLHTQIEEIVQRYNGTFDKTENWGRRKLAYEIGKHREGTYVVETITGSRRADERNRSPPARDRQRHPSSRRPGGRGAAGCRPHAERAAGDQRSSSRRARIPAERQPGEGRGDGDQQDDMEGAEGQR